MVSILVMCGIGVFQGGKEECGILKFKETLNCTNPEELSTLDVNFSTIWKVLFYDA